jgi:hypothetical protein
VGTLQNIDCSVSTLCYGCDIFHLMWSSGVHCPILYDCIEEQKKGADDEH